MFSYFPWLTAVLVVAYANVAVSADPPADQILTQLQWFAPELLLQHHVEIGLTKKQAERIRAHVEQVWRKGAEYQNKIGAEFSKLVELFAAQEIDETAAMKQLDKVLSLEIDLKRLHFQLMIRIRNELTAQQRKLAAKIKPDLRSKGLQQRLRSKLARIEKEVQRRVAAGQPPIDAIKLMQSFKMKMESGQPQAAEVVLDRVMKILGLGKTDSSTKNKKEK